MLDSSRNPYDATHSGAAPSLASPCLRCGMELDRLPEGARFCPRCGLERHGTPPGVFLANAAEERRPLADALGGWLDAVGLSHLPGLNARPTTDLSPVSPIVEGYANAMYKLGRRYEVGGPTGNRREALRCYSKSARLGNALALARLATCWMRFSAGAATSAAGPHTARKDSAPADDAGP